jgi:hypothetical protein
MSTSHPSSHVLASRARYLIGHRSDIEPLAIGPGRRKAAMSPKHRHHNSPHRDESAVVILSGVRLQTLTMSTDEALSSVSDSPDAGFTDMDLS